MLYGMYVSAAGAMANAYRQDVVANNLANAETVSFKRDLTLFQARRTQSALNGHNRSTAANLESIGGGIFALPTHIDFSQGSLDQTGGAYDVAISGKGFFQIRNADEVNYTRDGRFALDKDNQLVTLTGSRPVLDDTGNPIVINPDLELVIDKAGGISQGGQAVARLGIVDFQDPTDLRKLGDNLYAVEGSQSPEPVSVVVNQGHLESSSVTPVNELIEMIKAQRMFQANASMVQLQDQTLGLAVSRLGSIS